MPHWKQFKTWLTHNILFQIHSHCFMYFSLFDICLCCQNSHSIPLYLVVLFYCKMLIEMLFDVCYLKCCLPIVELVYLALFTVLSGVPNTQSACQTPKYCFLVGHACCIRNILQYRLSPAEYRHRQSKFPSSYQLNHLVLRHLSQVMKNPLCSGFNPGTSWTNVRCSNHYIIELCSDLEIECVNFIIN
jgi:hypothetical protein